MVNLLQRERAPELVEPSTVANSAAVGVRVLFTIRVADVDAVCAELERHGVRLLNGPIDRRGAAVRPRSLTRPAMSGRSRRCWKAARRAARGE